MSSTTEKIKERLGIVEVVESYLKLEKAGANHKAKCPFHNENTASFVISPSRGTYHCFGCHKGGDIFSFVEEIEGIDFSGALKILADRSGVILERENPEARKEQDTLYSILDEATTIFMSNLSNNEEASKYLKDRGLTGETINKFKLGYAQKDWTALVDILKNKGLEERDIEKTGLAIAGGRSGYYDRFRERIIFPISNYSGKIVGYSGRIFPEQKETAKYINSPETALYHKSKALYGYYESKASIRTKDSCILVEGQMDLLMSHQAGYTNTVAVSGTALTEDHLIAIKRLTNNLTIAFDSDQAGISASEKSFNLALSLDLDVSVVKLPKGKDPADVILENQNEWNEAIKKAKHIIDFYLDTLAEAGYDDRKFKLEVGSKVLPYVGNIRNHIDQAHFISKIANRLNMSEEPLWEELEKKEIQKDVSTQQAKSSPISSSKTSRRGIIEGKIFGTILWQKDLEKKNFNLENNQKKFQELIGESRLKELNNLSSKIKDVLIFKSEESYLNCDDLDYRVEDLLVNLELEIINNKIKEKTLKLKSIEQDGDESEINNLEKDIHQLNKRRNNIP